MGPHIEDSYIGLRDGACEPPLGWQRLVIYYWCYNGALSQNINVVQGTTVDLFIPTKDKEPEWSNLALLASLAKEWAQSTT
jgi:hypothetical protein